MGWEILSYILMYKYKTLNLLLKFCVICQDKPQIYKQLSKSIYTLYITHYNSQIEK